MKDLDYLRVLEYVLHPERHMLLHPDHVYHVVLAVGGYLQQADYARVLYKMIQLSC